MFILKAQIYFKLNVTVVMSFQTKSGQNKVHFGSLKQLAKVNLLEFEP